jgi:16S rRNA (adenine1518-N6/adenine1519-N6)-dimethyltransferase
LSVLSQIFFDCKCHFDISGKIFFPQTKVSSTVISLSPKNFRLQKNVLLFLKKILHAAFSQRRKILSNSLKNLTINIQEVLYNIGINPTSRAEQVSPKKYVELARVLHSKIQIRSNK